MDAQTTQLRQQITQTRAAMAATLDLLERRVSQKVAATVEQAVIGPVRSVQAMMAQDTIALQQAPWLIMAVGGLLGYASARKARLLPPLCTSHSDAPLRVPVSGARHGDCLRRPAAATRTSGSPLDARGAHEGASARPTPVPLEVRGFGGERVGTPGHSRNPEG
jgi:hypothetical protein